MKLDLIVPTHTRSRLLVRLLDSIRAATCPEGLSVRVIVVDNASSDDTHDVLRSYPPICGGRLLYLFEPTLGNVVTKNRGLRAVEGDLIGFVDDDERIDREWLTTVWQFFQDPSVDFISGP